MWRHTAARFASSAALYLAVLFTLMLALRLSDPAAAYLGKHASPDQLAATRHSMGLDAPFLSQYTSFVGRVLTLDFGSPANPYPSWRYPGVSVNSLLEDAIGPTLSIALPAAFLSTLLALALGILAAASRSRFADRALMALAALGMSVSLLALIVLTQSAIARSFPPDSLLASSGYQPWTSWSHADLGPFRLPLLTSLHIDTWARYCLAPVLLAIIASAGADARFYRAVFADEMSRPHIAAARARGVSTPRLLLVHAGRAAGAAVVTRLAAIVPTVITGSLLLETSFAVPGVGRLLLESILNRDFPVIQAVTALVAAAFILTHLGADLLLVRLDPRVRSA